MKFGFNYKIAQINGQMVWSVTVDCIFLYKDEMPINKDKKFILKNF